MAYVDFTYDRNTLYEEVWAEAVTRVAKRYGLSDVGLRKICKKLKVPLPPLGYWARVQHGRKLPRPPLPPLDGASTLTVSRLVAEESKEAAPPVPRRLLEQERFEAAPENRIELPGDLRGAHPIVTATAEIRRRRTRSVISDKHWALKGKTLDLRVSDGALRRALLIAQALLKSAERRGFGVFVSKRKDIGPVIEVLGEEIHFRIRERSKRSEREWTAEEKKQKRLDPAYRPYGLYEYTPTGTFVLELFTDRWHWPAAELKDERKAPLEAKLNRVMVKLVELALRRTEEKAAEHQKRLRDAEAQRLRWEAEARERKETRRRTILLEQVDRWRQAAGIRAFVDQVETELNAGNVSTEADRALRSWIDWARSVAEDLDPLDAGIRIGEDD